MKQIRSSNFQHNDAANTARAICRQNAWADPPLCLASVILLNVIDTTNPDALIVHPPGGFYTHDHASERWLLTAATCNPPELDGSTPALVARILSGAARYWLCLTPTTRIEYLSSPRHYELVKQCLSQGTEADTEDELRIRNLVRQCDEAEPPLTVQAFFLFLGYDLKPTPDTSSL